MCNVGRFKLQNIIPVTENSENLTVSYYIQPNLKINDFGGPLPERKKSETKQEWSPLLANSRKNIGKYFLYFCGHFTHQNTKFDQ